MRFDILLKNGRVIDALTGFDGRGDVGIKGGKIAAVAASLPSVDAESIIDAEGYIVMPGVIDSHVHVSTEDRWIGFSMMASVGVVTAVDFGGPIRETVKGLASHGCGMSIAGLHTVTPGHNTKDANPSTEELSAITDEALDFGALGLKIVGGHSPASPEATARIIEVANKKGCYVAFHVGSTKHGSNIEGFREAVELAGKNHLHIAHVNSYCRGLNRNPAEEALEAAKALKEHRNLVSESYLGTINGTSAGIRDGLPSSHVTRNCLKMGGYTADEKGMGEAILGGWALIHVLRGGKMELVTGREGYEIWKDAGTKTGVSFPVNDTTAMHILATARMEDKDEFVVDAISTDGGAIPRNVQLERGAALVRLGALTWPELVRKLTLNPARMLGFAHKGALAEGFDGDVTVADPDTGRAHLAISRGQIIMVEGVVVGRGGHLLAATPGGAKKAREAGLSSEAVDLSKSLFYTRS
ncbi:MAG: amidohydrolase family protein [Bacillota bacterium]|jgi:predicted amidohydrolase